jgi:hypothetical protein
MIFGIADSWHDFAAASFTSQLAVPSVPVAGVDSTDESLLGDPARRSPALTSAAPIVSRSSEMSDVCPLDLTP